MRRLISGVLLIMLLVGMLYSAFNISPAIAQVIIYIRADGSIDPPTAPISTINNVTYTLTGNIDGQIVVEKNDIVIDGAGYTLQGTGTVWSKGIDLTGRTNVTIQNTQIKNFGWGVFFSSSSGNRVSGNSITNTTTGVGLHSSDSNTINGNSMANNTHYGIELDSSSSNTISGNNITANSYDGVWLDSSSGNIVSGNNITGNPTGNGIGLGYSSNFNTISGNHITNNDYGIVFWYSSDYNIIYGNTIANDNSGIVVDSSSGNNISSNHISANDYAGVWFYYSGSSNIVNANNMTNNTNGIQLDSSSSNTISRNNITANSNYGVWLYNPSNNNSVSGNNITSNNGYGMGLYYSSDYNIINENAIASNPYGVFLYSSSNNRFYHNNFIDNTQQVSVSSGYANVWDDGYPSGGNHWTSYSGTDSFSGVYQNITGIDGIGDTPYIIDVNNSDTYPFMGPLARTAKGLNMTVYAEPDVVLTFSNLTITGLVSSYKRDTLPVWMPPLTGLVGRYVDVMVTVVSCGKIAVAVRYDDTNMTQEEEEGLQLSQWKGCDVTGPTPSVLDGIINMRDIALFANKFMILGGSEQWEPRCDVTGPTPEVPDGKVDMRDVAKACLHFTGTNSWAPITTYIDTVNNIIYGETTHFSIFGVH